MIRKRIFGLTEKQIEQLQDTMDNDPSSRVRMRAHCILLSNKSYTIKESKYSASYVNAHFCNKFLNFWTCVESINIKYNYLQSYSSVLSSKYKD